MAALLSHAVAGAGIAAALRPSARPPARYWALAVLCAVVPDFDIVVVWMGTNYLGMFGHRGFMHSISFAAALAAVLSYGAFSSPRWRELRFRAGIAFFCRGRFAWNPRRDDERRKRSRVFRAVFPVRVFIFRSGRFGHLR